MASLVKKTVGGRAYYYLAYSARVNGKPRIVRQVYLGRADEVAARLSSQVEPQAAPEGSYSISREFGASAALWRLVERLGLIEIIDDTVPSHTAALSVGQYIALAAINRCIAPTSKKGMRKWHAASYISSLLPAQAKALESQRFWDAMNAFQEDHITQIEAKLLVRVKDLFQLDVRRVMYDATNFFTFINTQTDCQLPQRGHNKAKRDDLRQVSLALLASLDFGVPLFHHCYAGNIADSTEFAADLPPMVERIRNLHGPVEEVTIVFDKGNNSEANFKRLDNSPFHFVGSLPPSQHPDLLGVPLTSFSELSGRRLRGVKAYRTTKMVFGRERTVVVTWNPRLARKQEASLLRVLAKKAAKLKEIQDRLSRLRTRAATQARTTVATVQREVNELLTRKEIQRCLEVSVAQSNGFPTLTFNISEKAVAELQGQLFGRNIIVTDHTAWSTEDIALAYRYQYRLEHQFRNLKDRQALCWWPLLHRTDQKIRVHAFYCVLGLLLLSLLHRELSHAGFDIPLPRMLKDLRDIEETTLVIRGSGTGGPEATTTLSKMSSDQRRMYEALDLGRILDRAVVGNTAKGRRKRRHAEH